MARLSYAPAANDREAVLTKAVSRAARHLGLSNAELAQVLGLSEASISRLHRGGHRLQEGGKPFELGQMLLRLFRGLDAITGGDDRSSASWLRSRNRVLEASPGELIKTVRGLVEVAAYVDAQRARI